MGVPSWRANAGRMEGGDPRMIDEHAGVRPGDRTDQAGVDNLRDRAAAVRLHRGGACRARRTTHLDMIFWPSWPCRWRWLYRPALPYNYLGKC